MLDSQQYTMCGCDASGPSAELLSVDAAVALALKQIAPLTDRRAVPLAQAAGQVVARDISAPAAMPYFDNSAMDGFALRCVDLESSDCLAVAGTVAAGDAPQVLPAGQALRIYTGAPLPRGADAVVMSETCSEHDAHVHLRRRPTPGDNIRRAGSDQEAGQLLIRRGTRLAAHHVGLLAANGIASVDVVRLPRVGIASTGDELCSELSGFRTPGRIPDANRPMLLALAESAGAEVTDLGILPDDEAATRDAFSALSDRFDLVLTSGAVSVGGKDHIRNALLAAGGKIGGWRVALKPGKPAMFGHLGRCAVTGLPGNPFAAYVGFRVFAASQIARLKGQSPAAFATVPARAGFSWIRKAGRAEIFPVRRADYDARGVPVLDRLGQSVSATLLPLATADGLAYVSATTDRVSPGDRLTWQPFCE